MLQWEAVGRPSRQRFSVTLKRIAIRGAMATIWALLNAKETTMGVGYEVCM